MKTFLIIYRSTFSYNYHPRPPPFLVQFVCFPAWHRHATYLPTKIALDRIIGWAARAATDNTSARKNKHIREQPRLNVTLMYALISSVLYFTIRTNFYYNVFQALSCREKFMGVLTWIFFALELSFFGSLILLISVIIL